MWEINTYGGGDFLRLVFTGISMIFGSDDYKAALQSGAIVGFIGILLMTAFRKGMLSINWMIGLIMIIMIGIVPKKDVIITDHIVPANSAVVANVPLGLALTATTFNHVGDYLTRMFETVFALPNQVQYRGNGLLFASHLVEESTRFEITNPRVSSNFSEFWKSCVYYDLMLGLYSWDSLLKATDLMGFLGANTSVTRSFTYQDAGNVKSILNCRTGLNAQMTNDLNAEITQATDINGVRLVPGEATKNASVAKFAASMPIAYQYITGMAMSNARIVSQNALANSLKRGMGNFASEADASAAAQDFALARSEQERRTTFAVSGKLAKRLLPIAKNIFEALIYAAFPVIMIMAMLPVAGKVLLGYAKALFWINMWAPLYAILNFAMTYFAQDAASAAVVQAGGGFPTGLSVMTNTGLGQTVADYSALAGYLSVSIPMIAWMFVSQSGAVLSSLAGRLVQSYDKPTEKASDEASSGNTKLGNAGFENNSSFQSNTSPSMMAGGMTMGDGTGNNTRIGADGTVQNDVTSSNSPMGINYGSMATSSARTSLSEATSAEQSSAMKLAETNAAMRSQLDSTAERLSQSQGVNQSFGQSERHAYQQARDRTESVMEQFAEREGINVSTAKAMAAEISAQASAGVKGEVGPSTPLGSAKAFAEARAGIAARAGVEEKMVTQDDYNKVLQAMSSEQYTEALRAEANTLRDSSASFQMGVQDGAENSLSSALTKQTQAASEHSEAVKQVSAAQRQMDHAEQVSASINAKGDDAFYSWLSSEKGMSNDEIRGMVRDANAGDLDSMRVRDEMAKEYVSSQLADYSQSSLDYQSSASGITSDGQSGMSSLGSRGAAAVSAATAAADSDVRDATTVHSRSSMETGVDRLQADVVANESNPGAVLMTPIEDDVNNMKDIRERQDAIKAEFHSQQDKGVIDRGIEGLKEMKDSLTEKVKD